MKNIEKHAGSGWKPFFILRRGLPAFLFILNLVLALQVSGVQDAGTDELDLILKEGKAALEDGLSDIAYKKIRTYLTLGQDALKPEQRKEAVILLARSMYAQKKSRKALDVLEPGSKWRRDLPEDAGFVFWRGFFLYETGEYDKALDVLSGLGREYSGGADGSRIKRLQAWCYLKKDMINEAIAAFREYEKMPNVAEERAVDLLDWGKALIGFGYIDEGGLVLAKLMDMPVVSKPVQEGRYWLGQVFIEKKELDYAGNVLTVLGNDESAADDLRSQAWGSLAEVYESRSDKANALMAFSNGVALAKSHDIKEKMSLDFGRLLVEAGRFEEGIPLLRGFMISHADDPSSGDIQLRLSEALLEYGKFEESVAEFQHYLETFSDERGQALAYAGKGRGLIKLNRYAEAAIVFKKAYVLFKEPLLKQESLLEMGNAYIANGQYKLADEIYQKFLEEFPASDLTARARYQLAQSSVSAGEYEIAERRFIELLDIYPGTDWAAESLLRIAEIKVRKAEGTGSRESWLDALAGFNRVMESYSNGACFVQALLGRGMVNYNLFRSPEALTDFERIVADFPKDPAYEQAYYMRGMCYYRLGRNEDAVMTWRSFVSRFPVSKWAPEVLFEVAKYEYNKADYKSAGQDFLTLVEKYPSSQMADDALLKAGQCAYNSEEYVRAEQIFARVAKEYPQSSRLAEVRFNQADTLNRLGSYSAAILALEEIIKKYPSSDLTVLAWMKKGDCLFLLGSEDIERYEESMKSYRVVVNSKEAGIDLVLQAEYKIGRCMEKMGLAKDAIEQYYVKVMMPFLEEKQKGVSQSENCMMWFWRASRDAADIMESQKEWKKAVSILERVVDAGLEGVASDEARERIKKIKTEHWSLFYY